MIRKTACFLLPLTALATMLLLQACSPEQQAADPADKAPGAPVAKVAGLPLLDGSDSLFDLDSLRGQVVLLDFWATWCPPCKAELPDLKELSQNLADVDFTLVGMTVDQGSVSQVADLVAPFELPYPVVLADRSAQAAFGQVRVVPTKFLLNREGQVVQKYEGIVPRKQLEADIRKLL